tara:strand:+ start:173 stop:484 length:312 start_codon:yes stop_codon:yes gene_type:complete
MNYEIIYKAANSYEAHFIKGLLDKYSIESTLLGENLSMAIGELPADVLQVDILVPKKHLAASRDIISKYEKNLLSNELKSDWQCSRCNNMNPPSFEICWHCDE